MYSQIATNQRKTWAIMVVFLLVVAGLAWLLGQYFGDYTFTVVAFTIAAVYAVFSYFNAGKLAVAINRAKEISQKDNPRLWRTVENLSITNGMPMPKLYIIDDPAPNAFATGRSPDHAIVAATSGLLDVLEDSELEGVMAHELGHVKNYDIRVSMIAFALVTAIGLIADIFWRSQLFGGRNRERGGGVIVIFGLIAAILAPIIANLLRLAISRKREYLADATGALTTRYPDGLASALAKIGRYGSTLKRQNTATAHLFFANPLSGGMANLFSTHPPVEERIRRLKDMGQGL
ncbi:MAG TPA: M48 family metalloprotease [Candidatus Saccharimonadales bacterium]